MYLLLMTGTIYAIMWLMQLLAADVATLKNLLDSSWSVYFVVFLVSD